MKIGEIINGINDVNRDIIEKTADIKKLTEDILETMSDKCTSSYDMCIHTGIADVIGEEEYPYYVCIENGSFCIMQDQDPEYSGYSEHEYTQISPEDMDRHDLVELVLRLPQILEAMLEEMQEEDKVCNEAYALLQKMQEVIQE